MHVREQLKYNLATIHKQKLLCEAMTTTTTTTTNESNQRIVNFYRQSKNASKDLRLRFHEMFE